MQIHKFKGFVKDGSCASPAATFETQEKQNTEFPSQATSASNHNNAHISANVSFATNDPEKCSDANTKIYHELFLMKIGVSNAHAFLSEDVQSSKKFMQVLRVVSVAHHEFSILKVPITSFFVLMQFKRLLF